jgi:DNA-binding SARP family transcriptional activator/predicted ATPase
MRRYAWSRTIGGVRIQVLGDVAVSHDTVSHARPVGGGRHRLILALLAARAGRTIAEDALIEAIWPNDPPKSARTALQTYVSELRDLFEPDRPRRSTGSVIATESTGYRLRVGAGWRLDSLDLEQAASAADVDAATLDRLLDGWGEPFAEVGDHPDLVAASVRVREAHARVVERRADIELAQGGGARLVDLLRDAVSTHPYRERLVEQLVIALYRSGDQRGALSACREYATRMRADLGLEPGPSITAIEHAVLEHAEDEIDVLAGGAMAGGTAAPSSAPPRGRRSRVDLVGRADDLARLRDAVESSPAVTIVGPSGVGKTALALAFVDQVGVDTVAAVDVAELAVADEPSIWRALADELGVGEQPHVDLAASVVDNVRRTDATVVIDTAEVAIGAVGAVVGRLAADRRGTCLVTSQVGLDVAEASVMRLGPLQAADASAMVTSQLEQPGRHDPEQLERLVDRLDGIPLALEIAAARVGDLGVTDTLASLERRGELLAPDDGRPLRHRSTAAAAAWSIAQLDSTTRVLLRRLATHRGAFDLATACHIWSSAPLDDTAVEQGLADLVSRSLVVRVDLDDRSEYRVLDTVRSAILGDASDPGESVAEHEMRLAEVVLETAQAEMFNSPSVLRVGQVAGELVRAHDILHAAGDGRELVLAGCAALWWPTQGRNVEGLELIERALRTHKATAPPVLYRLVAGVASFVSYAAGDVRKTSALLDEMGSEGMAELVPNVRLNIEGSAAFNSGRYDDAVAAYRELITHHPEPTGPKLLVMWLFGNALWYAGQFDESIEAYRDLRRTAESVGSANSVALSLRFEAMVHAETGELDRAWRLVERGLAAATRLGDPSSVCQAEVAAAVVAHRSDALDLAEQYALDAIRSTLRPFDLFTQRAAPTIVAAIALERDDPKRAALALGWYLDYLDRTGQLPVVATREMAARVEAETRERLGPAEYGRLAGRGAALSLAELYDELAG